MPLGDREELLDHARWLAQDSKLKGGPFDGLRIPDRFKYEWSLSIEIGGRAAFYERSSTWLRFCFVGFRPIGGEVGWPDIRSSELTELGVSHAE